MAEYMILKSGDGDEILTVGSLEWSPTSWSYTTSDPLVENLLSVVKKDREVEGRVSLLVGDIQYDFVPRIFEEDDDSFVGQLGDVEALTTPQIEDASADHQYVFAVSELAADRTITLPLLTGNDTFIFAACAATLTSAVLNTGVSGSAVLDQDDISSNSATQLATQQSIKAYVDAQVLTEDTLAELNDTGHLRPSFQRHPTVQRERVGG